MAQGSILSRVIRLLARSGGGVDLLPALHEHLVETCGGVSSLVVHDDVPAGMLRASSGWGIPDLPLEPWTAEPAEREAIGRAQLLGEIVALAVPDSESPIARLLGAAMALVVPLVGHDGPRGVVLVGIPELPALESIAEGLLAGSDAFVLALDRARSNRDAELRADVNRVLVDFGGRATRWSRLNDALGDVCRASARVFVASRVTAWLHDREARELVMAGASDSGHGPQPERVAVADALSLASTALHRAGPEIVSAPGAANSETVRALTIPLRGRRRAVGVLQLDGVHFQSGDHAQVMAAAGVLGQGLGMSIEAVMLLEQVVLGHWRLEGLLDATPDMTVLCDAELRIVRANQAFAARAGLRRDELAGLELRDLVGAPLAAWAQDAAADATAAGMAPPWDAGPIGGAVHAQAGAIRGEGDNAGGIVLVARDAAMPGDLH